MGFSLFLWTRACRGRGWQAGFALGAFFLQVGKREQGEKEGEGGFQLTDIGPARPE